MEPSATSNRRIARNTLMLYIRMFLMMGISLYTSRVVLQQLGVEDFGIYNIVGGVVVLMSFLNSSMAGATSRFLTFDIGKNDFDHLHKTFSSALQIHISIASIVVIVGESVGIWFVNTQLNIPETRIAAANIVFQMSLFTSAVSIIQVPFSATLIAHERMDIYAIIEIAHSCLKLGIIYLLLIIPFDKLAIYSILILIVAVLIFFTYRSCCTSRYKECHFTKGFHKSIIKPMLSFSGWDLYGNGCVVARQQGTNILLNQFFGVALNAASGVATQVSSAVSLFISNITMSVRPQIIKKYAKGNIVGMQKLLSMSLIICLLLVEIVLIPIYLNIETIMSLWLHEVPPYATDFTKFMLIANAVNVANTLFNTTIHASGKIKKLSIIEGSVFLSTVLIAYVAFLFYPNPNIAYGIWAGIMCVALGISMTLAKSNIPQLSLMSIFKDIKYPLITTAITICLVVYINPFFEVGILRIFTTSILNLLLLVLLLYLFWIVPVFKGNIKSLLKSFQNEDKYHCACL